VKHVEKQFAGRTLKLEAGRLAKQQQDRVSSNSARRWYWPRSRVREHRQPPYFPLTVEYREKAYAAGKIPAAF